MNANSTQYVPSVGRNIYFGKTQVEAEKRLFSDSPLVEEWEEVGDGDDRWHLIKIDNPNYQGLPFFLFAIYRKTGETRYKTWTGWCTVAYDQMQKTVRDCLEGLERENKGREKAMADLEVTSEKKMPLEKGGQD